MKGLMANATLDSIVEREVSHKAGLFKWDLREKPFTDESVAEAQRNLDMQLLKGGIGPGEYYEYSKGLRIIRALNYYHRVGVEEKSSLAGRIHDFFEEDRRDSLMKEPVKWLKRAYDGGLIKAIRKTYNSIRESAPVRGMQSAYSRIAHQYTSPRILAAMKAMKGQLAGMEFTLLGRNYLLGKYDLGTLGMLDEGQANFNGLVHELGLYGKRELLMQYMDRHQALHMQYPNSPEEEIRRMLHDDYRARAETSDGEEAARYQELERIAGAFAEGHNGVGRLSRHTPQPLYSGAGWAREMRSLKEAPGSGSNSIEEQSDYRGENLGGDMGGPQEHQPAEHEPAQHQGSQPSYATHSPAVHSGARHVAATYKAAQTHADRKEGNDSADSPEAKNL